MRKRLDLHVNLVHGFSIPGLKLRHDNVDIVVIRYPAQGHPSVHHYRVLCALHRVFEPGSQLWQGRYLLIFILLGTFLFSLGGMATGLTEHQDELDEASTTEGQESPQHTVYAGRIRRGSTVAWSMRWCRTWWSPSRWESSALQDLVIGSEHCSRSRHTECRPQCHHALLCAGL